MRPKMWPNLKQKVWAVLPKPKLIVYKGRSQESFQTNPSPKKNPFTFQFENSEFENSESENSEFENQNLKIQSLKIRNSKLRNLKIWNLQICNSKICN